MLLDLQPVLNGSRDSVSFDELIDLSYLELIRGEYPLKKPVRVWGEVLGMSVALGLHLKLILNIEAEVFTICGRCNKELCRELTVQNKYYIVRNSEAEETGEEKDDVIVLSGNQLELDDYIRDNLIVNVPMRYLCKDDCKGLCPICGNDLNIKECGCHRETIDPRLEALKDFFED